MNNKYIQTTKSYTASNNSYISQISIQAKENSKIIIDGQDVFIGHMEMVQYDNIKAKEIIVSEASNILLDLLISNSEDSEDSDSEIKENQGNINFIENNISLMQCKEEI